MLPLQTLQTSKSTEESFQEELQQLQSKLEEEIATHKRDNSANLSQVAELEGTVREEREKRERQEQERERERAQLQAEINRLSKELSDNKVCVHVRNQDLCMCARNLSMRVNKLEIKTSNCFTCMK